METNFSFSLPLPQAYCNFSIFVAVVSFLVGTGLTARLVRLLYKDKEESFFGVFVDIVFTFFLTLIILISSIFLRLVKAYITIRKRMNMLPHTSIDKMTICPAISFPT